MMPDHLDAAREERNWEFWRNEARRVGAEFAEQAARYEALVAGARTLKRGRDLGGTILMQEGLIEVLAALAALEHEERN